MATMEDRLMGEKLHYYCSSDEEEEEEEEDKVPEEDYDVEKAKEQRADEIEKKAWMEGSRKHNTGAKGVKEDARMYQRYILEKEQEKIDILAKAANRFVLQEPSDDSLDDDEEFMAAYRAKRMSEMKEAAVPVFGVLRELSDANYCETIDGAPAGTDVCVYIYEDYIPSCRRYKEDLMRIAADFPKCLICCIKASAAKMSANFIQRGLPTFISYRNGEVRSTWVNIREFIGDDADYDILVEAMQDNNVLPY